MKKIHKRSVLCSNCSKYMVKGDSWVKEHHDVIITQFNCLSCSKDIIVTDEYLPPKEHFQ